MARDAQRLARQAQARVILLAARIGQSVADDMLIAAARVAGGVGGVPIRGTAYFSDRDHRRRPVRTGSTLTGGCPADRAALPAVDLPALIGGPTDRMSKSRRPVDPTGHGGLPAPPRWGVRYRPPDWLRRKIIDLHGTCRYPECERAAQQCEIDHLVKFDHTDPSSGGWSVPFNLVPLCGPDHQRKHLGLWTPVLYSDLSIDWTSTRTGETVTTYPLRHRRTA
ncbi:MAG: HNH endonuclease signature motif containing protein [Gordonia sp. (in: high G+C Gram-positive bacteria)]